ncbi:hypothetical protein P170DRAFT_120153 [Aspergillus steynii IBT 23096]|uniref:Uncharacterized protein n=1 Tax=Aspergillus steynii IBT 23096 TaxID=1392250 RepID=A0A2I2GJD9_9EURO|nr:uncharacterized protein P170DRAFT_120153 [Aspergillus steynii IBT 23096]PLB52988.1 hypothetical protein P170DRAFT_120153 [Aspergillus steynii IBT 23096]
MSFGVGPHEWQGGEERKQRSSDPRRQIGNEGGEGWKGPGPQRRASRATGPNGPANGRRASRRDGRGGRRLQETGEATHPDVKGLAMN